jgi:hypothetical protein
MTWTRGTHLIGLTFLELGVRLVHESCFDPALGATEIAEVGSEGFKDSPLAVREGDRPGDLEGLTTHVGPGVED